MSERSAEKHDDNGFEITDPTPMQPPLGYKKSLSLSEQIAQQVRIQSLRMLEDMRVEETPEEADDFNVGEDFQPFSPHEIENMPTLANLKKKAQEINDAIEKRKLELAIDQHKEKIAKTKKKVAPEAPPTDHSDTDE